MKALIIISFFLLNFDVFAQDSSAVKTRQTMRQSAGRPTIINKISARVGAGIQRNFYTELGIAKRKQVFGCTGFSANAYYLALEWHPKVSKEQKDNIYGVKFGYEFNAMLPIIGIEGKYQTDFNKNDFIITPKVGLGLLGDLNIFYGYNISLNNLPFDSVGRHQFSIVCHFGKSFLKY